MNPRIDKYGNQFWYNEQGQVHRTDGPAVIHTDGSRAYSVNGKLHRLDAPAIIRAGGTQYWYIHGNRLTEEEFNDITQSEEHLNWYLLQIL